MSYSSEILTNKLKHLNETQQSIVSISQWIVFHQRHAAKTAEVWAKYTQGAVSNAPKQVLPLIYLANDIVQQARSKRKTEFLTQFAEHLPRVLHLVWLLGSVDTNLRKRIERVVGVWESRRIFDINAQKAIERAISGSKGSSTSSSGSDVPELAQLTSQYGQLQEAGDVEKFNKQYVDLFEADQLPAPKEYLTSVTRLTQKYIQIERRLQSNISVRGKVVTTLKQLLQEQEQKIQAERTSLGELQTGEEGQTKKERLIETEKDLQELVAESVEPEAPVVEELTPPPLHKEPSVAEKAKAYEPNGAIPIYEMNDDAIPAYEANSDSDADDVPMEDEPPLKKQKTASPEVAVEAVIEEALNGETPVEMLVEDSPKVSDVVIEPEVDVSDLLSKLG
ncbi:hypothetical protein BABINDRAFT_163479 [Babjeviella inositovora NRRL Y-12698]|uniref:CID domain-containing protein n=1 Tax=Babjeviella inositovora NRRL Y-12698 TaxID=984486 RepID=A0A1E3QIN4_9ASCO|nr:uncharacterized protein BABINDRAFT_163479 [Babjeviella inositovora NRRL Y-12698]ODQ77468.1 hypothetical protein BABINDRAFT_163479 [Babjeviella inositovora NRRL Y-12698]